jgi:peptide-methionine (R)-S-oxide reductase
MPTDKNQLSSLEYKVLFEKATEAPFSHIFNSLKDKGTFVCKNCEAPLFDSDAKYDSGSGWPSFYEQIAESVTIQPDFSHGMERTEIICSQCQCHLGHIFTDGPNPTGLRYCVNGTSLDFQAVDE